MRLRRRRAETEVPGGGADSGDFASLLDRELNEPSNGEGADIELSDDGPTLDSPDSGSSNGDGPAHDQSADNDTGPSDLVDFWASYDEARAAADLFAVPPAAAIAVVGPLNSVADVVDRVRKRHGDGDSEVVLLTDRANGACDLDRADPTSWTIVRRPDDLVAILDQDKGDAPVLVVDVPGELPTWIRSLITSLRDGGLDLVHYVLEGQPTDEDLATWHGQLGRPSVLDLASPIEPTRVLELLDRGEPIASIGGVVLGAELLLALRMEPQPSA